MTVSWRPDLSWTTFWAAGGLCLPEMVSALLRGIFGKAAYCAPFEIAPESGPLLQRQGCTVAWIVILHSHGVQPAFALHELDSDHDGLMFCADAARLSTEMQHSGSGKGANFVTKQAWPQAK